MELKEQIQELLDMGFTRAAISRQSGVGEASIRHWLSGLKGLGDKKQEQLRLFVEQVKKDIAEL